MAKGFAIESHRHRPTIIG